MKHILLRKDYIRESLLEGEEIIILIAYATAIIDSELEFFKKCYSVLLEEETDLVGKDLTVFFHVDADFSSGDGIFKITDGTIQDTDDSTWDRVIEYFGGIGIKSLSELKDTKEVKVYTVNL